MHAARWIGITALFVTATAAGRMQAPPSSQSSSGNSGAADPRKLPSGYLKKSDLPDSLTLLPPPPAQGSAAMQRDEEARGIASKLKGSARYQLASSDAVIGFPELPDDFSCAAGFQIGKAATPTLYALLQKSLIDVGLSTYRAKDYYKRTRPFVVHGASTCYPKDEALLRGDGSYPSGHSAIGWGYALILSELIPSRSNRILKRGYEFGQSRLVCDAHWQSDIDAGRVIAAAAVARLHADQSFQMDLSAARREAQAVSGNSPQQPQSCQAEETALR